VPPDLRGLPAEEVRWQVQQVQSSASNTHNHELLEAAAFSRYCAKGIAKRGDEIIELWKLGFRPNQILTKLRADPDPDVQLVNTTDIYNFLQKHQRLELAGRTPI
jgi:hypothetical protein